MERNKGIDIAKGITILLVIVGHTNGIHPLLRNFIFSFHMPLFFILAGYFYREKSILVTIKADFKRLLVPYIVACFLFLGWNLLICLRGSDWSHFEYAFYGVLWGSGSYMGTMIWGDATPVGAIWFLPALFWCKSIYNFICKQSPKGKYYVFPISIIATIIGEYLINLPLSLLQGMSAMMFYGLGRFANEVGKVKSYYLIAGIVVWVYCIGWSHCGMVTCDYGMYPLDILGACAATWCVCMFSTLIRNTNIGSVLAWCGINSLYILVVHFLENQCVYFWNIVKVPEDVIYRLPAKIALTLLVVYTYLFVKENFKNVLVW